MLAVAIGVGLTRHADSRSGQDFADGSAMAFAFADLLAVRAGQRRVYLADAVVECLLIASRHLGTSDEHFVSRRTRSPAPVGDVVVPAHGR